MNCHIDAKQVFENQYNMARQLKLERAVCSFIGNLGMVNYQSSQRTSDGVLLDLAIQQLTERVDMVRYIKKSMTPDATNEATIWEAIGLSRLSLCYTARGLSQEAIKSALGSVEAAASLKDPTVITMPRFFYGHALLGSAKKH